MPPKCLSSCRCPGAVRCGILTFLIPVLIALLPGYVASGDYPRTGDQQQNGVTSAGTIPGVVIVKVKRAASLRKNAVVQNPDALLSTLSRYGVLSIKRAFPWRVPLSDEAVAAGKVDLSRVYRATIPSGMNPVEVAAKLAALPEVEYAEPKYLYRLCNVPNDSDYAPLQQVYLDRMQVASGWALQKGSTDVVIATVDGGTYWQHPDLAENIWVNVPEDINHDGVFTRCPPPDGDINGVDDDHNGYVDDVIGWNYGNNANDPRGFLAKNADHGTQTASIFGAVTNNGIGMAGTSWNCRVMPVCASHRTRDEYIEYGDDAIEYASRMGARVINCSWERAGGSDNPSVSEQEVITAATQSGCLVVAAAGNNQRQNLDERPFYPASYDHVLSVGATEDTSDRISYFTDYGLNVTTFAPGMRIRVARDSELYGIDQGTSDATPLVAGLAGLLFAAHPDWTPEQVAAQIRMTSDPIEGENPAFAGSLGHGRVNFFRALSETHSGVVVTSSRLQTPSGREQFLEGDTIMLSVRLKNVLALPAENLAFNVSYNPVLSLLGSVRGPARLAAGAEDSVRCDFLVCDVDYKRTLKVRLGWTANGDEHDAHMFTTTVYSGGGYWVRQESPTTVNLYSVHAVNCDVVWATGHRMFSTGTPNAVLRTIDGGEKWVCVNGDLSPSFLPVCVFAIDALRAWVGGSGGQIFATVDGGVSWTLQNYPAPQSGLLKALWFFDAHDGYAWGEPDTYEYLKPGKPGRYVLLRTTDGGATWTHLPNEPSGVTGNIGVNAFSCTDRQHIWFGATDSAVWRTTDGGATWSSSSVGGGNIAALAMHDDSVGLISSVSLADDKPAFFALTTDCGTTWQSLPSVKPDRGWAVAFPPGSSDVWVAGDRTVARSRDHGATWAEQPTESFSQNLIAMSFCDGSNGWMTTDVGEILRYRDHAIVPQVNVYHNLPVGFVLEQNYPNPFNGRTEVRSQMSEASHAKLAVYDLLGREVAVLVNERRGIGTYHDTFNGTGLASGVYFYRLTAGNFVRIKKCVLLK